MVPVAAGLLLLDVAALVRRAGGGGLLGVLAWLGAGLTCAFYVLIIWNYLRRGAASVTCRSVPAACAAVAATLLPTALPLLGGRVPGAGVQVVVDVLLVAGTGWSVWALRRLGRNLSVLAQAREVADRGPYRVVRHPLYTGELTSTLGVALAAGTGWALATWVGLVGLQVYRARTEERVLLVALPGYREYRDRTAALVPGLLVSRRRTAIAD
jgi:protein-S-isoprenylcysteine O-methyltransferase Ste14